MARPLKEPTNKAVGVRMTPAMRRAVDVFADKNNMNASEASRTLIAWALSNISPQDYDLMDVMKQNARAEWMEHVNAGWRAAIESLANLGLRD